MNNTANFFVILLMLFSLVGCDQEGPDDPSDGFDRAPMLENYADNLIIPAMRGLADEAGEMTDALATFSASPSLAHLEDMRVEYLDLFTAFQYAAVYDFGPAETNFGTLFENQGTWPVDTALLESYIASGDSSLNNFDRDTRGLPALGYLLYGDEESDEEVLSSLQNPTRLGYLRAVVRSASEEAERIAGEWEGDYRQTFLSSIGTSAGSSTSMLYNSFVLSFERLKNFKLGLPLGLRSGQIEAEPDLVEAYYSRLSYRLLQVHFEAVEKTHYGMAYGSTTDGIGFPEYLVTVVGGPELIDATQVQIRSVVEHFALIPSDADLAQLIRDEDARVSDLHTEMQKLTRFFKSDMSSLLGISITYDSGDGD